MPFLGVLKVLGDIIPYSGPKINRAYKCFRVRGQESGVRGQGSGVRGQELEFRVGVGEWWVRF